MTKTGIVFSGGGGKGAYAIGVWKALREFGLDQNIQAVAGTSVGGLNGALFIQGDIQRAEQLWLNISPDKVLHLDLTEQAEKLMRFAASAALPGFTAKAAMTVAQSLLGKGWFSQQGLQSLIEESNACSAIPASGKSFYVCALNQRNGELELPALNERDETEIIQWLLASAAIPGVFSPIEIQGIPYWDGGVLPGRFSNNTPFQPLIDLDQCTHIINIYLDRSPQLAREQKQYAGVKFWNIIPSEAFDGLIAALNFTPDNARKLIDLGYEDTIAILKRFQPFMEDESRFFDAVCEFSNSHQVFCDQIELNQQLRSEDKPVNLQEVMAQLAVTLKQQESQIINHQLDKMIEEMKSNSDDLLEQAFTAITTLASTDGRINNQLEQNWLGRMLGTLNGSNWQQQAEVNHALNASLYATQSLIQKLNHKQMLTMEAMVTLGNKTQYLMGHINMLYAAVQDQNQKTVATFQLFADGLQALTHEVEQRFQLLDQRLDRIEQKQALDDWFHEVRNLAADQPLNNLLYATASFYEATGGSWSQSEINRYKSALADLRLSEAEIIPAQLFETAPAKRFAEPLAVQQIFPVTNRGDEFHTLLKGIQHTLDGKPPRVKDDTPEPLPLTGLQLGLELLYSLRRNDRRQTTELLVNGQLLSSQRYLKTLEQLGDIATALGMSETFQKNLSFLIDRITHFKVIVPVIGKFSAGKSALINRYLGRSLLASDITPETAVATEIAYGERESLVLNYLDGRQQEQPLETLASLSVTDDLTHIQLFLTIAKLQYRPDLVLVDMPGFDSKNDGHQKAIAWYLGRGDTFINLMPADVPFDDSVIRQLEEIQFDYQKSIACLISKANRRTPSQITELQQQLNNTLTERALICDTPAAIEARDADGTIEPFETVLDQALSNKEALLSARYGQAVADCTAQVLRQIDHKLHALGASEPELVQQINDAKSAIERAQQQLKRDVSQLRYNLCSVGREQLLAEARQALNSAHSELVRAADSGRVSTVVQECVRPVVQVQMAQLIQQEVERLQAKLDSFAAAEGDFAIHLTIPPLEKEQFSTTWSVIGASVAWLLTGPVGGIITGIIGGFLGKKDNTDEREQHIRSAINNQVIPETLQKVSTLLETELNRAVSQLSKNLQQALADEQKSRQQQLQTLRDELQQSRTQREEQKQQLSQWQQQLQEIA